MLQSLLLSNGLCSHPFPCSYPFSKICYYPQLPSEPISQFQQKLWPLHWEKEIAFGINDWDAFPNETKLIRGSTSSYSFPSLSGWGSALTVPRSGPGSLLLQCALCPFLSSIFNIPLATDYLSQPFTNAHLCHFKKNLSLLLLIFTVNFNWSIFTTFVSQMSGTPIICWHLASAPPPLCSSIAVVSLPSFLPCWPSHLLHLRLLTRPSLVWSVCCCC